jgi:hypothetical protein
MDISRSLARHIIETLGSFGTPPVRGIQHFNVGNQSLLAALDEFYLSSYLQDGGAAYKMVVGDYGSGKSHFLYCLRDVAWARNFAVAKVDLSPIETPYNDQKKVYEAVAQNIIWHEADENFSDETGLTRFLQGTLERVAGADLSLETLSNPLYRGLVDTLEASVVDSPAYQTAVLAYFDALIRDNEERLDSLSRWLMGETTSPDDTNILREVGVTGKINKPNAFRMLRSLCQVIRALSYSGLILLFDEVDRMASVGGKEPHRAEQRGGLLGQPPVGPGGHPHADEDGDQDPHDPHPSGGLRREEPLVEARRRAMQPPAHEPDPHS